MKASAIIGANYGDEGKGHITNFLSDENTLNVRFNGGAQAAHAVFLEDGRNHVFHHFGAGSLKGTRTLLASHFIVNPIFFIEELIELGKKTHMLETFIDPRCRVSTHYDMLINEFSCKHREKNDTTGLGVNETVERSQFKQLRISVRDLIDKSEDEVYSTLKTIRNEYLPWRLEKLSLPFDSFKRYCDNLGISISQTDRRYLDVIKVMAKCIVVWPDDSLIDKFLAKDPKNRSIVFEGAQGMLLDQNRKELSPDGCKYLTRSSTGLKNVFDCLRAVRTPLDLEVFLVTRAYLTRHGEGPMWNEVDCIPDGSRDSTNLENKYQGKMRYGHLDKAWYNKVIKETVYNITDSKKIPQCVGDFKVGTAMTCLDQINENAIYCSINETGDMMYRRLDEFKNIRIVSRGANEKDIKWI